MLVERLAVARSPRRFSLVLRDPNISPLALPHGAALNKWLRRRIARGKAEDHRRNRVRVERARMLLPITESFKAGRISLVTLTRLASDLKDLVRDRSKRP
jgi:hypothetical protein